MVLFENILVVYHLIQVIDVLVIGNTVNDIAHYEKTPQLGKVMIAPMKVQGIKINYSKGKDNIKTKWNT